jgi:hypothetical protein
MFGRARTIATASPPSAPACLSAAPPGPVDHAATVARACFVASALSRTIIAIISYLSRAPTVAAASRVPVFQ